MRHPLARLGSLSTAGHHTSHASTLGCPRLAACVPVPLEASHSCTHPVTLLPPVRLGSLPTAEHHTSQTSTLGCPRLAACLRLSMPHTRSLLVPRAAHYPGFSPGRSTWCGTDRHAHAATSHALHTVRNIERQSSERDTASQTDNSFTDVLVARGTSSHLDLRLFLSVSSRCTACSTTGM